MNMIQGVNVDNNEFVTLKVLILLSPGIFMHKDSGRLKDKQRVQRIIYHFPKFFNHVLMTSRRFINN
jgi:hypothetical protein